MNLSENSGAADRPPNPGRPSPPESCPACGYAYGADVISTCPECGALRETVSFWRRPRIVRVCRLALAGVLALGTALAITAVLLLPLRLERLTRSLRTPGDNWCPSAITLIERDTPRVADLIFQFGQGFDGERDWTITDGQRSMSFQTRVRIYPNDDDAREESEKWVAAALALRWPNGDLIFQGQTCEARMLSIRLNRGKRAYLLGGRWSLPPNGRLWILSALATGMLVGGSVGLAWHARQRVRARLPNA